MERLVLPTITGDKHECYAITEEGAGSDVTPPGDRQAERRRIRPRQREVHVTSANPSIRVKAAASLNGQSGNHDIVR